MRVPYRKPGKFSQIKSDPLLTPEKFNELKNKLDKLIKFSRPKAAEEVKRLAELGDFSENVEYQLAKGRLRGINQSIMQLENQIQQAEIVEPPPQYETVQVGHKVTIEMNNKQKTYQILGSVETNPEQGIISYNSPIGSALMGHKVEDNVKIKLLDREVECKIIKIE